MDASSHLTGRVLESVVDIETVASRRDSGRTLTATAVFHLSEEGRKASLLDGGGRAVQEVKVAVPTNRFHLVSVDGDGVARLKLQPRHFLDDDQNVVRNDAPPTYDAPRRSRSSLRMLRGTINSNARITSNRRRKVEAARRAVRDPAEDGRGVPRRSVDASPRAPEADAEEVLPAARPPTGALRREGRPWPRPSSTARGVPEVFGRSTATTETELGSACPQQLALHDERQLRLRNGWHDAERPISRLVMPTASYPRRSPGAHGRRGPRGCGEPASVRSRRCRAASSVPATVPEICGCPRHHPRPTGGQRERGACKRRAVGAEAGAQCAPAGCRHHVADAPTVLDAGSRSAEADAIHGASDAQSWTLCAAPRISHSAV